MNDPRAYEAMPDLRTLTSARVGLGRSGVSATTKDLLAFRVDHSLARDAVHAQFDAEGLAAELAGGGLSCVVAESRATNRADHLRRPDRGRRLSGPARDALTAQRSPADVALIVSDGLSATAVNRHAATLVGEIVANLGDAGMTVAPIVIVPFGRVALLNDVGAALGSRCAAIVIGERPGLSAPDSLSVYTEVNPAQRLTDADRNCISNIRPGGLPLQEAARRTAMLLSESLRLGRSGTTLKVEYPSAAATPAVTAESGRVESAQT
ncbi:MAG: ethanolamine ammonia-lyase subunit EutC [Candidatus Nanopelagicales bacterium]